MATPSLRDLQALFWRALQGEVAPALTGVIRSTPALGAADRIEVYADMYVWRLQGVLAEDFEKVAGVLGDERFAVAARGYLVANPSEHPSVRHVGRRFADHLASDPPAGGPGWIADLARLEWARVEVFDALDVAPVRMTDLCALPAEDWAGVRLEPIPALRVVESAWPVHRAWDGTADLDPYSTRLRVWRQDHVVYHCAMDATEAPAFDRFVAGESFAAICESWADLPPEPAAAQAASLLARWLEDGLIARLHAPS